MVNFTTFKNVRFVTRMPFYGYHFIGFLSLYKVLVVINRLLSLGQQQFLSSSAFKYFKEVLNMTFGYKLHIKLRIKGKLKINVWPSYRLELMPNLGNFCTRLRFKFQIEYLARSFDLSWICHCFILFMLT